MHDVAEKHVIEVPFVPREVRLEWHGASSVLERVRSDAAAAVRAEFETRFSDYKRAKLAEIEQLRQAVRAFSEAIRDLRSEAEKTLDRSLQHALRLAGQLAEKLVSETYGKDPKRIAAIARRVASELTEQTDAPVLVRLHPATLALLESEAGAEAMADLVDAGIALSADPQVPKGAVMAEADRIAGWWYPEQELAWLMEALWAQLTEGESPDDDGADSTP